MTLEEIRTLISSYGLEHVAGNIERLMLSAIHIVTETMDADSLPVGASKFGGYPDLPPGAPWPVWHDIPLGFLAQFSLAEFAVYDLSHRLPPTGILSFFYEADTQPWGHEPEQRGAWQVAFWGGDASALHRTAPPTHPAVPEHSQFAPHALTFQSIWTVPDEETYREQLGLTDDERKRYWDFQSATHDITHQLLGHPIMMQSSMQPWCEQHSRGIVWLDRWQPGGAPRRPGDIDWRQFVDQAVNDWHLLLQLDSMQNSRGWDTDWGLSGLIYFWIRDDALAARDFSNVWLQLQTT